MNSKIFASKSGGQFGTESHGQFNRNLQVTIKYPEMVAQIYPYFQHDKLADFGKENLWFL